MTLSSKTRRFVLYSRRVYLGSFNLFVAGPASRLVGVYDTEGEAIRTWAEAVQEMEGKLTDVSAFLPGFGIVYRTGDGTLYTLLILED